VRGDAFRYQPPGPVDWLLSDVVAYPARIDELLAEWFAEGWCRWFVVTVKFQGRDDDEKLAALDERLAREAFDYRIRRLSANKNEATIYGCLPQAGAQRVGL
jgi:23S rRNA (cytidine2498-2'-O)-methyltransferase